MAGSFYGVPGGPPNQIVGGRNINELIDYEYVLERGANAIRQLDHVADAERKTTPTAVDQDDELRRRADNDGGVAAARELARR